MTGKYNMFKILNILCINSNKPQTKSFRFVSHMCHAIRYRIEAYIGTIKVNRGSWINLI